MTLQAHSTGIAIDLDRLREADLFKELDPASIAEIASGGWALDVARGERVLARGDHLDGLFVVLQGKLKLYMLSCQGVERILRVLCHGDSFGEAIMFNEVPSPVFVDALSSVRLGYLPRDVIHAALVSRPEFLSTMLASMSALMRNLIQDLETACLQNASQRTVNYLLREAKNSPPPYIALTLPAPKAVIASTLNMSPETFSRELHRLQDLGYIEIARRVIYLRNRHGLRALADGAVLAPRPDDR